MADDEDDKVRRNLVAASFLTILAAWLDIPLAKLAFKLLENDAGPVLEWKLWVVVLTVFAYLLIRYRFSREGFAYVQSVRDEFRKNLFLKSGWFVDRNLQKFARTGVEHPIFHGELSKRLLDTSEAFSDEYPYEDQSQKPTITARISDRGEKKWDMSFAVRGEVQSLERVKFSREFVPCKLNPPSKLVQMLIEGWAWMHTLGFSEASVRNVFPVWLATGAICTVFWRVFRAYAVA